MIECKNPKDPWSSSPVQEEMGQLRPNDWLGVKEQDSWVP